MSEFYDLIDEYLGDEDSIEDIRVVVRRNLFFDFDGYPTYLWEGQGKLFTIDADDNIAEWLGTIAGNGVNLLSSPKIKDGRDGSSASYPFTLNLVDFPGQTILQTYNALKAEQWRVAKRKLTIYLTAFKIGEGLRPTTPISFFKELTMMSVKFSENIEQNSAGQLVKKYSATVNCKDGNFGRSETPNGTYADTIQKERAREHGVELDRGCEFLALMADRTYQLP